MSHDLDDARTVYALAVAAHTALDQRGIERYSAPITWEQWRATQPEAAA